jgi:hypothetical protein
VPPELLARWLAREVRWVLLTTPRLLVGQSPPKTMWGLLALLLRRQHHRHPEKVRHTELSVRGLVPLGWVSRLRTLVR